MSKHLVIGKWCHKHRTRVRHARVRICYECYKEHKRDWARRRRKRDRTMSMIYSRLRRRNQLRAMPPWADRKKIAAIYARRKPGQHVDHRVPLKGIDPRTGEHVVCGLHVHYNLRIVNSRVNDAKWAYWIPT